MLKSSVVDISFFFLKRFLIRDGGQTMFLLSVLNEVRIVLGFDLSAFYSLIFYS